MNKLILASASPRRVELLQRIGLDFDVVPSHVEEIPGKGETPGDCTCRLAEAKARQVALKHPGRWVIGADTLVVLDGEMFGKPDGTDDTRRMLRRLSGRTHRVITGFSVVHEDKGVIETRIVETEVDVKPLSEREIEGYLATGEPLGKAGAYAIQGVGAFMVTSIRGSYTNVVGLPLCELLALLEELGAAGVFAGPGDGLEKQ